MQVGHLLQAHLLLPEADAGTETVDTPFEAAEGQEEAAPKPTVSKEELMQRAAAELPPMTNLGPSGHVWELTEEEAAWQNVGHREGMRLVDASRHMPLQFQVLPAAVATGRVPDGLEDTEVRKWVKQRFGKHAPVHRMAIILLTGKPPGMEENRRDSDTA
ncbi:Scn11a [Symbiodinium necroappetens]|uniref:Scn11a protein n=1 Tax=Symbiodinium necroappetens TaxID=1628268 RepID=A0A812MZ82_9DINO|nr:Scn11a [Symbiodinium necroappetens]